jgi:hypothetical protein
LTTTSSSYTDVVHPQVVDIIGDESPHREVIACTVRSAATPIAG